jgi:hypothetical protein
VRLKLVGLVTLVWSAVSLPPISAVGADGGCETLLFLKTGPETGAGFVVGLVGMIREGTTTLGGTTAG